MNTSFTDSAEGELKCSVKMSREIAMIRREFGTVVSTGHQFFACILNEKAV